MRPRVAINGFGRIGRHIFRANLKKNLFDVVAINDLGDTKTLAHLLKYDSTYGILDADIKVKNEEIMVVNGKEIHMLTVKDPTQLPWKKLKIDVALECTGVFEMREQCEMHLKAGAKRVVLSAPPKGDKPFDWDVVLGVNEKEYNPKKHYVIANVSCTTNCLAPIAKVLHDAFGIKKGLMTTAHSYTNDQRILDLPHKDLRRARAAALSIIPTTTGAAKAVGLIIPELKGKLTGVSLRVPTPTVSIVDLVVELKQKVTAEEVNNAFKKAAKGPMKGYLEYTDEPLVSVDFRGNPHSAIVDGPSTLVIDNMVKVLAWYDNEWGYSNRMVDLVGYISKKGI